MTSAPSKTFCRSTTEGKPAITASVEVDTPGHLVVGDALAQEGAQFVGELGARLDTGRGMHDSLHRFAHLLVGDADHRDIEDVGMQGERVLDLLRVDVHSARDDHGRFAVGEERVALVVDVADIAGGGSAAGRAGWWFHMF